MFKHILVPLDGSPMAEAALPVALSLATRAAGRITVLHVVEPHAPATVHGAPHLRAATEAAAYLARVAECCRAAGVEVACHVHDESAGAVAQSIAAHVRELGPDTIVMARHGRAGLRGMLFGSLAEQVASAGTIPVLLVHARDAAPHDFACERILIPHDGDPAHSPSLTAGLALARLYGADVRLLAVVPTRGTLSGARQAVGTLLPGLTRVMLDVEEADFVRHLESHVRELAGPGINLGAAVVRGEPARMIARAARDYRASVVVMATHGHAGTKAFWEDSKAARVCAWTEAAVLLVPAQRVSA